MDKAEMNDFAMFVINALVAKGARIPMNVRDATSGEVFEGVVTGVGTNVSDMESACIEVEIELAE